MRLSKGVQAGLNARRRLLLAALGGVLPWPPAWAQGAAAAPLVAFLAGNQEAEEVLVPLRALGYAEGRNLRAEIRGASGVRELPGIAMQLIALEPSVLVAS